MGGRGGRLEAAAARSDSMSERNRFAIVVAASQQSVSQPSAWPTAHPRTTIRRIQKTFSWGRRAVGRPLPQASRSDRTFGPFYPRRTRWHHRRVVIVHLHVHGVDVHGRGGRRGVGSQRQRRWVKGEWIAAVGVPSFPFHPPLVRRRCVCVACSQPASQPAVNKRQTAAPLSCLSLSACSSVHRRTARNSQRAREAMRAQQHWDRKKNKGKEHQAKQNTNK